MLRIYFASILLAPLLLFFSSCGNERVGCTGQIIVENPIPDTTLYLGGESFIRDVSQSPVVFKHTENTPFNIQILSTDVGDNGFIVETERRRSDATDRLHVIVIKPNSEGEAYVEITASDGCEGNTESTGFNVTVVDSTN